MRGKVSLMGKIVICTALATSAFLAEDVLGEIRISISPPVLDISLKPGTSYDFTIFLTNLGDTPLSIVSKILPFTLDEFGTLVLLEKPDEWSCVDWIKLERDRFDIQPNSTISVKGKAIVPWGVAGGRHSAVVFEVSSKETRDGMGIRIKSGTLVFISVPFTEKKDVVIVSFSGKRDTSGSILFSILVENRGNTYVKVEGDILIKDSLGRIVRSIPIKDDYLVLPQGKRLIQSDWDGAFQGEFSANVRLNYGGHRPVEASTQFLVEPSEEGGK
jgi:hypothetical protein